MSKNKLGLIVGIFFGLIHLVWSFAVAIIPYETESFMNWILRIHHIDIPFIIITPFVFVNALMLIVITFAIGYILGWILAWIFNLVSKRQ